MPDLTPEQLARQQIDAQLAACGWVVQDFKSVDFSAGRGIALREVPLTTGPCDYLLLVDRKALGVIEAKKEGTTLSTIADQSGRYASSLPDVLKHGINSGILPFLYESTGVETFFRDERDPAPRSRRVFTFHRPETLAEWAAEPDTLRARLKAMPFAHPLATLGMRDCQIEAITGLEQSFAEDRPRALIHMATGAGKTFTACAFTYRLIKFAKARRVLFLVDRANLGEQARDEFHRYSPTAVDDYESLKAAVSTIDIVGILAREIAKTNIDTQVTKQAIAAVRAMPPEVRSEAIATLLKPSNLETLAPVFGNVMRLLRSLYGDLDDTRKDLADQTMEQLFAEGSHLTQNELNLSFLLQVFGQRQSAKKESVLIELFEKSSSPLIRKEIILIMAKWRVTYWLSDILRRFGSLSKWERKAFIVAAYHMNDEGEHWLNHAKFAFSPDEKVIREWYKARLARTTEVPL